MQGDLLMQSEVETISPLLAAQMLENNKHNRPLDKRRSMSLANAIKRGEWVVNGDAIRFATDGQLLDGQHRLMGIVLSGKSVDTLVVRGLPPETFTTIDLNRKSRNPRDVLALSHVPHYTQAAPIARLIYLLESTGNPYHAHPETAPTVDQVLAVAQRPEVAKAVDVAVHLKACRRMFPPALLGLAYYTFAKDSEEHAAAFFRKLETGAGLEVDSPILALRERVANDRSNNAKLRPIERAGLMFKAFKFYRQGVPLRVMKTPTNTKSSPYASWFVLSGKPLDGEA